MQTLDVSEYVGPSHKATIEDSGSFVGVLDEMLHAVQTKQKGKDKMQAIKRKDKQLNINNQIFFVI